MYLVTFYYLLANDYVSFCKQFGPDKMLGLTLMFSNCLTPRLYPRKFFFEIINFEKISRRQKSIQNYPAMKKLK